MEGLMFSGPQEGILVYTKPAMFVVAEAVNCRESEGWVILVDRLGNTLAAFQKDTIIGIVRKIPGSDDVQQQVHNEMQFLQ